MTLSGFGHNASFVGQMISGLPSSFAGVLDISSRIPVAAIGYLIMDVERSLSRAMKKPIEALDTNIRIRLLF